MNRILIIRGGAIGDFILTLPGIKLLRDRYPRAHIELLGHLQIIALARNRFYADAVRSIESGALATLFAKDPVLSRELTEYFGSFDLIVSYLFDPEGIFQDNLRRCGIKLFIAGPAKLSDREHAALQLARPLEALSLYLEDRATTIYLADEDREFARNFLGGDARPIIAFHPGSGSETKNWPIENWKELGERLFSTGLAVLVISGEADEERARFLDSVWKERPVRFAKHLPLTQLAGLLENALFLGHDSGISHLAASAGARCILLFGPTDSAIWAPMNERVTVLQAPDRKLGSLGVPAVAAALRAALRERG